MYMYVYTYIYTYEVFPKPYNIFVNLVFNQDDDEFNKEFFFKNLNLLKYFQNNQNIIIKYYYLAKLLNYADWILFFETLLSKNKDSIKIFKKLNNQTKDYNLKKIIKLYN